MKAQRIVLVGGGHAMLPVLQAARRWTRAGHTVTLFDPSRYLYYSGMVPEYLGGVYRRSAVRIDLQALCQAAGVQRVEAAVAGLAPASRTVATADGRRWPYDVAAFDVGTRPPGQPEGVVPSKPLHRLLPLADRVEATLHAANAALRLAIVGGGAAGVECALNLSARFVAAGRAHDLTLHLVEAEDRLLPGFPTGLQAVVQRLLEARGAHLHTGAPVATVRATNVQLATGHKLPADAVLWATGTAAPAFFEGALATDARGFAQVASTLQTSAPGVFAAGDCATVQAHPGLANIGVHAVKQGPVLRDNLDRVVRARARGRTTDARPLRRFRPYPVAPLILSTGTSAGLWTDGTRWLRGRPLLRVKHYVDRSWMSTYAPRWRTSPRNWLDARAPLRA
ncbi:NAD(P)/FAD-dependent oxidoreductase [Salisaeta longa]|uniref:NAD(P)/FAD-dependent oxidoreductase n=1 Tax=Salisaeta longa TaxID=503170 RepID=UPI0003B30150|nr:FAD-dependent oxidoreductase [Salisaeta longa]